MEVREIAFSGIGIFFINLNTFYSLYYMSLFFGNFFWMHWLHVHRNLQLLTWVSYVNPFLHCFHMWDSIDVPTVCPKLITCSQHIFHFMDCSFAYSDDGYILAFKGMLIQELPFDLHVCQYERDFQLVFFIDFINSKLLQVTYFSLVSIILTLRISYNAHI